MQDRPPRWWHDGLVWSVLGLCAASGVSGYALAMIVNGIR